MALFSMKPTSRAAPLPPALRPTRAPPASSRHFSSSWCGRPESPQACTALPWKPCPCSWDGDEEQGPGAGGRQALTMWYTHKEAITLTELQM